MKKLFLTCATIGLLFAGAVRAENYAGLGYGASWNGGHAWTNGRKSDYDTFSGIFSLFAGKVIPTDYFDLRVEGEYLHLNLKPEHGKSRRFRGLMANATGIIPDTGWWAEPYVGLGLGYARWDHNNTIAGQVIGGFEKYFELPEWANNTAMAAAVEYKHLWVNENGGKRNNTSKMNSDTVMFKLKYLF